MVSVVNSDSIVRFHHIKFGTKRNKKGEYDILRLDTNTHLRVGEQAYQTILLLHQGQPIGLVASKLNLIKGEVVDLVKQLSEIGILRAIDEETITDTSPVISPLFPHLPDSLFSWLLSWPVLLVLVFFICSGLGLNLATVHYLPSYKDFFWHGNLLLTYFGLRLLDFLTLAIHEAAHYLATRAVGGQARISFSHRAIYFVAETESYHLAMVPKSKRMAVHLAGMIIDLVILSGVVWSLYLLSPGEHQLVISLLKAVGVMQLAKIIWQCNIFLETDVYNILSELTDHDNLRDTTKLWLYRKVQAMNTLPQLLKKALAKVLYNAETKAYGQTYADLTADEQRHIRWYSFILLVGVGFVLLRFSLYTLPRDLVFLKSGLSQLIDGLSQGQLIEVSKAFLLLLLVLFNYLLLILVLTRKSHLTKRSNP